MKSIKIIDVVPKDIYITVEFSSEAIVQILDFLEKAISLYSKVYVDGPIDGSLEAATEIKNQFESVLKTIEEETGK